MPRRVLETTPSSQSQAVLNCINREKYIRGLEEKDSQSYTASIRICQYSELSQFTPCLAQSTLLFSIPLIFAAHWALWIPSYENGTAKDVGRMIYVEGNASDGFTLEFRRNYDLSLTSRKKSVQFLCSVDAGSVVEVPGGYTKDTTPADVIDQWALSVVAPGPSL